MGLFSRKPVPKVADSNTQVPWATGSSQSNMRGHPVALDWWQRGTPRTEVTPTPIPKLLLHRQYDRGAGAYSPSFGILYANVIGAGYVSNARLPTIGGPGARYQFGAIWFNPQTVPVGMRMSPTMSVESVRALLGQSHVAAMYATTG